MEHYEVIDRQKCSFMDYTHEEEWTVEDIRQHLRDQFNDNGEGDRVPQDVSIEEMLDIYDLDIRKKLKAEA